MGLGLALARRLLQSGFSVAICARHNLPLDEAIRDLEQFGPVHGTCGNVHERTFTANWLSTVRKHFGRLDALVNNASTLGDTPLPSLLDTTADNLIEVFQTNAVAPVLLAQAFLSTSHAADISEPTRLIVNVSSDAAVGGYVGWGVYGGSKAALDLFTKTLAQELPKEVHILGVDPGDMDTAMHRAAAPDDEGLPHPDEVAQVLLPLFLPLKSFSATWDIPSGTILQVLNGKSLTRRG